MANNIQYNSDFSVGDEEYFNESTKIKYGIDDVHHNKDQTVCCWNAYDHYRLQTYDENIADRIKKWSIIDFIFKPMGKNGRWVFGFHKSKDNLVWVCKSLGLPLPSKSPGRVAQGKARAQILHSKSETQKQSNIARHDLKKDVESPSQNKNKAIPDILLRKKGDKHVGR